MPLSFFLFAKLKACMQHPIVFIYAYLTFTITKADCQLDLASSGVFKELFQRTALGFFYSTTSKLSRTNTHNKNKERDNFLYSLLHDNFLQNGKPALCSTRLR